MRVLWLGVAVCCAACTPRPAATTDWPEQVLPSPGAVTVLDVTVERTADHALQARVVTQGAAETALLRCRVTHADTRLAEAETRFAPAGTSVTEFRLWRPDGWPDGRYRVEVELDGRGAATREIQVPRS
jgi:hypothetical protein